MKLTPCYLALFLVFFISFSTIHSVLAHNSNSILQNQDWELTITGTDENVNSVSLVVGTSETSTNGYDQDTDQYAPPASPQGSFDLRIVDGTEDYFKLFKPTTNQITTWKITGRPSSNGERITFEWDSNDLDSAAGLFFLDYSSENGAATVNMREKQQLTLPDGPQEITIRHTIQQPVTTTYSDGWQLVGYPVQGDSIDPYDLFANAMANSFFNYQGTYSEESVFTSGSGFWLRLSESEQITYSPPFLNSVSLEMEAGWHLISGPGLPVPFTSIDDPDDILVPGTLQAYDNGYFDADTLKPGYGYWILSDGSGTIHLQSDYINSAKQTNQPINELEEFAAFTVSNDGNHPTKFFIGGSLDKQPNVNPLSFSMPPGPPNGAFDIRFENNSRIVTDFTGRLLINSPGDSLTFSYVHSIDDIIHFVVYREGTLDTEEFILSPDQDLTIEGANVTEIELFIGSVNSADLNSDLPQQIGLDQNYPNPFNPSTSITYHLPNPGNVQLEVFDMTGRLVSVLDEGMQPAGSHSAEFDASFLSSGVYIYRLQSAGSILTRKMTLIK